MAEVLTLTAPVVRTRATYELQLLYLDWGEAKIVIRLLGSDGEVQSFEYRGAQATTMMVALNKANLTTKSLQRRVLETLVNDGYLAGAISGTPA